MQCLTSRLWPVFYLAMGKKKQIPLNWNMKAFSFLSPHAQHDGHQVDAHQPEVELLSIDSFLLNTIWNWWLVYYILKGP